MSKAEPVAIDWLGLVFVACGIIPLAQTAGLPALLSLTTSETSS
jgi:hypothetical protein